MRSHGRAARVRRGLAVVGLLGLTLAGAFFVPDAGSAGAAPNAPAPPVGNDGTATYDQMASCVAQHGRLLVVLLVDESGSLRQTDPKAVRVAAAKTALSGLSRLTEASSGAAKVDVQVAAFSNTFKVVGPWSGLTDASLPTLQRTVDTLAARNSGMDTDFINALAGARESLAEQAVAVSEQSQGACKAILLFTDGRYDLGVRTTPDQRTKYGDTKPYASGVLLTSEANVARVERLGTKALCRLGGVADQVRADDISTLTIALTAKIRPADQEFLEAVTSGKGGAETCGGRDGSSSGVFLPASDLESLIGTFDAVATRIAGGSPVGSKVKLTVCAKQACPAGQSKFTVSNTLRRVHLFVTVPDAATRIEVRAGGVAAPLVLDSRTTRTDTFASASVRSTWPSPKAVIIDIVPGSGKASDWSVTLVRPAGRASATGSLQQYSFSDLVASLGSIGAVQVGKPSVLSASVRSRRGGKVAVLRSAVITAQITDPITGAVTRVRLLQDKDGFSGTYRPSIKLTASVVEVVLGLNAITRDGVALTSTAPAVDIAVRKPKGYPLVGPSRLVFSPVTGRGKADAQLLVFAAGKGAKPGCAWLGGPTIKTAPDGTKPVALSVDGAGRTSATCVASPASGNRPIALHFSPGARASGSVRGSIRIFTRSADGPPLPTDIPFSFEMTRGIDKAKQLAVFGGLLAVGICLPLILLLVMNLISTRFQAAEYVQGANLPVVVKPNGELLRVGSDGKLDQLRLFGGDFKPLPPTSSSRRFTWAGLEFSARTAMNPFAPSYATASPEGGTADVAREGRKVNLALSLAGSWVFLYDTTDTERAPAGEIHGRLVAFVARGPVPPQAERLVGDMFVRLPRTARRLDELAKAGKKG